MAENEDERQLWMDALSALGGQAAAAGGMSPRGSSAGGGSTPRLSGADGEVEIMLDKTKFGFGIQVSDIAVVHDVRLSANERGVIKGHRVMQVRRCQRFTAPNRPDHHHHTVCLKEADSVAIALCHWPPPPRVG